MQFVDVVLSPCKWVVERESVNVLLYKALNLRGREFGILLAKFIKDKSSESWIFEMRTFKIRRPYFGKFLKGFNVEFLIKNLSEIATNCGETK